MRISTTLLSSILIFALVLSLAAFNPISAQQSVEDQYWNLIKNSKSVDDFKDYLKEFPKGKYAPIARLKVRQMSKTKPTNKTKQNFLITPTSVGDIRLGMTIAEARKVLKGVKFVQTDYSEEGVWVELSKNGTELEMRFMTDQKDHTTGNTQNIPIKESAKIESIQFSDKRYKTADGIKIGTTISDAEKIFGKVTKIEFWEYDASEHIEFSNASKSYSFEISPKKGSKREARAGIYGKDEYKTTKYNSGAFISSFQVSKYKNKTTSENKAPKFEDYPAEEFYTGINRPLVLDSFGKMFKTRLSNAIKNQKPTFAGKYIVTGWGCGTGGCNTGAIIDAKTGRAYPFPVSLTSVTQYNSDGEAIADFQDKKYQLNSRLMMFAGNLEGSENTNGEDVIEYYEFKNGKFIFIKSMLYGKSKKTVVNSDFLITKNSIGKIKLGMTVAEARKAMPNAKFSRTEDGEISTLIAVKVENKEIMTLYADEKDSDEKVINENAKIEHIQVWSDKFKTAKGVHPKMKVSDAVKIYGKVTSDTISPIESRRYIDFANQPKYFSFRVEDEDFEAMLNDEKNNIDISKKSYKISLYIHSIEISK